jgi:hypothetical protein
MRRTVSLKHPVVPAFDLVEGIAHGVQEIAVGVDDRTVQAELDHGLRPADGGYLAREVGHSLLVQRFGFQYAGAAGGR